MPIYEFSQDEINKLDKTTFTDEGYRERDDLQRLLRKKIEVIDEDILIIAEEFNQWEKSQRSIDLLGVDRKANLVVIELKRTEDGGHMDLQAIRYAAMISAMTFDKAVDAFKEYQKKLGKDNIDSQQELLEFLDWDEPDDTKFGQEVRIVLVSSGFSTEITTSVLWLNDKGLDIRCVRLEPYKFEGRILVDAQKIVPLPEAEKYQIQVREKNKKEREARKSGGYDLFIDGEQISFNSPKNWTIYHMCKYLCGQGITPDEIATVCNQYSVRTIWCSVDGEVNGDDFLHLIKQENEKFDPRRYRCEDENLIRMDNKTYAFSTQWGDPGWSGAMNALISTFSKYNIEFSKTN